jgi:hypothetical protein
VQAAGQLTQLLERLDKLGVEIRAQAKRRDQLGGADSLAACDAAGTPRH